MTRRIKGLVCALTRFPKLYGRFKYTDKFVGCQVDRFKLTQSAHLMYQRPTNIPYLPKSYVV